MPQRVRRSGRIAKEVPIVLIGSDTDGKVFTEETKTVVLSRHGAGILSRYKLAAEDEVIIRSRESNKEAIAHVVGQLGLQNEIYTYGVAFADPNIHFWNTQMPPPTPAEMVALRMALQCKACGEQTVIENAEEAADVYAINEGIVRFCKACGYSTVWILSANQDPCTPHEVGPATPGATSPDPPRVVSSPPVRPAMPSRAPAQQTFVPSAYSSSSIALDEIAYAHSAPTAAAPKPVPKGVPEVTASPVNRRKYVRARVTFAACVRTPEFGDDITRCEDISKGGLRFKSRKHYPIGMVIEVAVPFSSETHSIFVRGRVVFVQDLPDESMTRHGVCYLPSSAT
jgi:hypothetical protein